MSIDSHPVKDRKECRIMRTVRAAIEMANHIGLLGTDDRARFVAAKLRENPGEEYLKAAELVVDVFNFQLLGDFPKKIECCSECGREK